MQQESKTAAAAERIVEGLKEADASKAGHGWYGFVSRTDVETIATTVAPEGNPESSDE